MSGPADAAGRPVGEDDLAAFVDGRLPADRLAVVSDYLGRDPDVAARLAHDVELRAALRELLRPAREEPVPARLRVATIRAGRRSGRRRAVALAAAACLLVALGGGAGWFARDLVGGPHPLAGRAWPAMASDAMAAHRTYAVEIAHPVEVRAVEEVHLGQWLSKRLKRRLVIPDLEERFGLALVGGRLLPADRDVAALLMYADPTGARLTLYVRSGEAGESALNYLGEGDLSSFAWVDEGYGYVVAGAMDRDRLQRVARAVAQDVDLDAARNRRAL